MTIPRPGLMCTLVILGTVSGGATCSACTDSPTGLGSSGSCVQGCGGSQRVFVAMVGSSSLLSVMLLEPSRVSSNCQRFEAATEGVLGPGM